MKMYKVCVYAIARNEEFFVERWMESMSEADEIIVLDTGSTDNTVEKLKGLGAKVYIEKISPWRFDVARNKSLECVPEDADICICTDLDEIFTKGWREKLEKAWRKFEEKNGDRVAKSGRYLYNWSFKSDGTPDVQFTYFKIHERHDFFWTCPIHEYVDYKGDKPLEKVFIDDICLNHYPDHSKSRNSYLDLLQLAVEENPESDRMTYYLGREYMYVKKWKKCIETLEKFLELPNAVWNEERCAGMRWIAKSFFELKEYKSAFCWYYRAIAEASYLRDPYVEFAQICHRLENWPLAYYLTKSALSIKEKSTTYVNMGYSWDHTPDDICSLAAYNLGILKEAKMHAENAVAISPNDERLQNNLKIITGKMEE